MKRAPQTPPTMPEMLHVAHLRDDGWVGQWLVAKHRERYPDSTGGHVRYLIAMALNMGLCR